MDETRWDEYTERVAKNRETTIIETTNSDDGAIWCRRCHHERTHTNATITQRTHSTKTTMDCRQSILDYGIVQINIQFSRLNSDCIAVFFHSISPTRQLPVQPPSPAGVPSSSYPFSLTLLSNLLHSNSHIVYSWHSVDSSSMMWLVTRNMWVNARVRYILITGRNPILEEAEVSMRRVGQHVRIIIHSSTSTIDSRNTDRRWRIRRRGTKESTSEQTNALCNIWWWEWWVEWRKRYKDEVQMMNQWERSRRWRKKTIKQMMDQTRTRTKKRMMTVNVRRDHR